MVSLSQPISAGPPQTTARQAVPTGPAPDAHEAADEAVPKLSSDYVRIALAAQLTGYSQKAIRRKIESGIWIEGQQFRRAPDGRVLISLRGYKQWVEKGRA